MKSYSGGDVGYYSLS